MLGGRSTWHFGGHVGVDGEVLPFFVRLEVVRVEVSSSAASAGGGALIAWFV